MKLQVKAILNELGAYPEESYPYSLERCLQNEVIPLIVCAQTGMPLDKPDIQIGHTIAESIDATIAHVNAKYGGKDNLLLVHEYTHFPLWDMTIERGKVVGHTTVTSRYPNGVFSDVYNMYTLAYDGRYIPDYAEAYALLDATVPLSEQTMYGKWDVGVFEIQQYKNGKVVLDFKGKDPQIFVDTVKRAKALKDNTGRYGR